MSDQGGSVRLRLSPPDLGSLRIEVAVRNNEMTAHLEVQNPTARSLLLDHLGDLRDRLASRASRFRSSTLTWTSGRRAERPTKADSSALRPTPVSERPCGAGPRPAERVVGCRRQSSCQ